MTKVYLVNQGHGSLHDEAAGSRWNQAKLEVERSASSPLIFLFELQQNVGSRLAIWLSLHSQGPEILSEQGN